MGVTLRAGPREAPGGPGPPAATGAQEQVGGLLPGQRQQGGHQGRALEHGGLQGGVSPAEGGGGGGGLDRDIERGRERERERERDCICRQTKHACRETGR